MAYEGIVIALDVASKCGVAEGRPGEVPRLYSVEFRRSGEEFEDSFGRAVKWMAQRLAADDAAVRAGDVRVMIEAPIMGVSTENTNSDTLLITKGLWAAVSGFARARGIMVRRVAVSTVRKHFIGSGRVPKAQAKKQVRDVCRALGWEPPNLDAADAAAVWHYAAHLWNPAAVPPVDPLFLPKSGIETGPDGKLRPKRRAA